MGIIEEKRKAILREMMAGQGSEAIHAHPVFLEPPFAPFGLRPERNSPFKGLLRRAISKEHPAGFGRVEKSVPLRFLRIKPSKNDKDTLESAEQLIISLPGTSVIGFEIIGQEGRVSFQMAAPESQTGMIVSQLRSHFPGADIYLQEEDLVRSLLPPHPIARAYRLKSSHFFPLSPVADSCLDPLRALFGILGNLRGEQKGVMQVLFIPLAHDWQDNMRRASRSPYDPSQSPFMDLPTLPKIVDKKLAKPLYAVGLRLLASDGDLLFGMEQFLKQFENGESGMVAIPGAYPVGSIVERNTHAHGAILNLTELSLFLHLPASDLLDSMPSMERAGNSYAVPAEFAASGPVLGINTHRGIGKTVRHSRHLPNQHVYSCGKSGYGKSNLILFSAMQRIENGEGVGIIDPHGSLIKQGILPRVPQERIGDVVYFNAGDFDYPMAINPLSHGGSKLEREHIRSDFLSFCEDLFEAPLGVNIQHALNFFIITLLAYRDSTVHDMERLLLDKSWRKMVLASIDDDRIQTFWEQEFPLLERRGIITAISNKLSPLTLPNSTIAPMLCGRENKVDFLKMMNEGKIFLCNLSHGDIGKRNSQLLGKLLVSKLQIAAMMREGEGRCPDFYLYIDEFQHMTCPSMADILSGARKFGLHLWLANQMIGDIPDKIQRHIFNASTLIFFATDSPSDQSIIEKNLSRRFKAEDIGQLKKGEAYVKMVSAAFNMMTERAPEPPVLHWVNEIIAESRKKYTVSGPALRSETMRAEAETAEKLGQKEQNPSRESGIVGPKENSRSLVSAPALSPSEELFLECVFQNPALSVTNIYRSLKMSAYTGDKTKSALKDKGLVREVTTHLGSGRRIAKFLLLTPQGFSVLGIEFDSGDGKGGVGHRYWQSIIRFHAEGLGYRAVIEEQIPGNSEAVDVGLGKDGKRIAVEISVTTQTGQEVKNIAKCLNAGYDRVVTLFLEESKATDCQSLIDRTFSAEEQARLSVGLAYDFGRFFS